MADNLKKMLRQKATFHTKEENENVILNESKIGQSGNSDVDVNVTIEIETVSIAYAMLCSMWAKNEMTDSEFDKAIEKLEQLTNRNPKTSKKQSQTR